MTGCGKEILVKREGTDQLHRVPANLDPGSVELNDFTLEDWMKFAVRFAEKINYFEINNADSPVGDWKSFFVKDDELNAFLKTVEEGGKVPPHLALFVSFAWLLAFTQKRFNQLTKRHLDFYYQKVLNTSKNQAVSDNVYVLFELAKNFVDAKVPKNTLLDAGKDANGKKLVYKTTDEIIVNKATIGSLRSIYNQPADNILKVAPVAGSFDGLGAKSPAGDLKWWPYGYYGDAAFPELPAARIGFSIASPVFEMNSGNRLVRLSIQFSETISGITQKMLLENISIYLTTEKGWIGPLTPETLLMVELNNEDFRTEVKSGKKITLAFRIPETEKAIAGYNQKIHGETFNTEIPVCRFLIDTSKSVGYLLWQKLSGLQVESIVINTDVSALNNFAISGDQGLLNAAKPFNPFGTMPVRGVNFNLSSPEIFSKNWKKFRMNIEWKNTPVKSGTSKTDSFAELYAAYRAKLTTSASPDDYKNLIGTETGKIVTSNSHFKATLSIKNNHKKIEEQSELELFKWKTDKFNTQAEINNKQLYVPDADSVISLSLKQSFYHEMYPRLYALALSCKETSVVLPNEPYTPLAEKITVGYSAEDKLVLNNPGTAVTVFYHEHPFGQSNESFSGEKITTVPAFKKGGHLLIGIENIQANQQLSLLFQLFEGSENPSKESFAENEKTEWSVLCNNRWKRLDSNNIICDETDNLLKSGLVKLVIPSEATSNNTMLTTGLIWIKASIEKDFDAVCKVIGIKTQSAKAVFENNGNDLSHLKSGISEGIIKKPVSQIVGIKGVLQPFNSFGGRAEETDEAYYRRISERLRHKNRAITIWDYEHLILEKFPEVFKVKCLNHTKVDQVGGEKKVSFLAPGNLLIVVIPDIVNKNMFDIFQPQLSKAVLNSIQNFVNGLNSIHVKTNVINPFYEEVTVSLKVKFRKGFDEIYYQKVLNEDLINLLSPWAFDKKTTLSFSNSLHRSAVINYLEKLEYVDYLADVVLNKQEEKNLVNLEPDCPMAILVSAKQHDISLVK